MCLSVFVLLVNKSHYWLVGRENTTYVLKPSCIVQEKLLCHENSCLVCKYINYLAVKNSFALTNMYICAYICIYIGPCLLITFMYVCLFTI